MTQRSWSLMTLYQASTAIFILGLFWPLNNQKFAMWDSKLKKTCWLVVLGKNKKYYQHSNRYANQYHLLNHIVGPLPWLETASTIMSVVWLLFHSSFAVPIAYHSWMIIELYFSSLLAFFGLPNPHHLWLFHLPSRTWVYWPNWGRRGWLPSSSSFWTNAT